MAAAVANGITVDVSSDSNSNVSGRTARDRARRDLTKQLDSNTTDTESEETDSSELPRVTTRRAWSDYCTNKGRSSQSEEENNNS